MSEEQPQRPRSDDAAITYGDVFGVRGNIGSQPVAPGDAEIMQSAENSVLGYTQIGGPAAVMQSASELNVARGVVDPNTVSDAVINEGVTVSEDNIGGTQLVTERVGGEVVGKYVDPRGETMERDDRITIGEAIKAAEVRAIGSNETPSSGIGDQWNARVMSDQSKTSLSDVLADASSRLPGDKKLTREDAEGLAASLPAAAAAATATRLNHNA